MPTLPIPPVFSTNEINDIPIPIGKSSYMIDTKWGKIELYVYRPVVLTANPIIISLPGRDGNGEFYINQSVPISENLCSLLIVPNLENFPINFTLFGNVYPQTSYDQGTGALKQNQKANPIQEWSFLLIFYMLDFVYDLWNNAPNKNYLLNGADASGLFIAYFSFFYPIFQNYAAQNFKNSYFPIKLLAGVSSFYFFVYHPLMKISYVAPINNQIGFTGEIIKLLDYNILKTKKQQIINSIETAMDTLTNDNAYKTYENILNNVLGFFVNDDSIYEKIKDLNNPFIYESINLNPCFYPFPYGVKNLTDPLFSNIDQMIRDYLYRDISFLVYQNDTNIYGGVTPELTTDPTLINNIYTEKQGPYRLFRTLSAFYSNQKYSYYIGYTYNHKLKTFPSIGHNSSFAANSLIQAKSLSGDLYPNLVNNFGYDIKFFYKQIINHDSHYSSV